MAKLSKKQKAQKAALRARYNPYVQRIIDDEDLRDNLMQAYESGRKAYSRLTNGKSPTTNMLTAILREPAMNTGCVTPGTLDTWTSLPLVSAPETAPRTGAGSQPSTAPTQTSTRSGVETAMRSRRRS